MTHTLIALGSNVGDSPAYIEKAVELLRRHVKNIVIAPLYRSKAVGYEDQPDFTNTALTGETDLRPLELLDFVKSVEQEIGRIYRFRWGPREIDIDIILFGSTTFSSENLTIPHKLFRERDFVLRPASDIAASWIDPVTNKTVLKLLEDFTSKGNLSVKNSV